MDTINDYVRKKGVEELIKRLEEVSEGDIEQHKFPTESRVSVDDWFEFLSKMGDIGDSNTKTMTFVDFNYLEVENEAFQYVNKNSPVNESELVDSVTNRVKTATKQDVESWLFNITADKMNYDEDGNIVSMRRSFDPSVY
jgi:Ca2+-binding EF-hand superfamily protein